MNNDISEQIVIAVKNDNVNLVETLLESDNSNVDARDKDGNTLIMIAINKENEEMVKLLMEKGANLEAENNKEETPLVIAVDHKSLNIVKLIVNYARELEKEGKINLSRIMNPMLNGYQDTLITHAKDNFEIVDFLIRNGSCAYIEKPEDSDISNWPYNQYTYPDPKVDKLVSYVLKFSELIREKWNIEEVKRMLHDSPWLVNTYNGGTPLYWAAWKKDTEHMQLLLDYGADINKRDIVNATALLNAIREERGIDIIKFLLEHGADPNIPGCLSTCIGHTANPNYKDRFEVAKLLFKYGADPNLKGPTGHTALHNAVLYCGAEMVQLFLENGADISIKDSKGRTALDIAKEEDIAKEDSSEPIKLVQNLFDSIKEGKIYKVKKLLRQHPWLENVKINNMSVKNLAKNYCLVDESKESGILLDDISLRSSIKCKINRYFRNRKKKRNTT